MTDPSKSLGDLALDILVGVIVGAIISIGAIGGWFNAQRRRLYDRMHEYEKETDGRFERLSNEARDIWKVHNEHEAQLRVLTTCQGHISNNLLDIKGSLTKVDEKVNKIVMHQNGGRRQEED